MTTVFACCAVRHHESRWSCDTCRRWYHNACHEGQKLQGIRMCRDCAASVGVYSAYPRSHVSAAAAPSTPPPPAEPLASLEPPKHVYRAFASMLPGSAQPMDSMEGLLPDPWRPVCVSPEPGKLVTPEEHVLHGYHKRSCWLSATTGLAEALAFTMFAHAKEGATPFSRKRRRTDPPPARRPANANPEPIVKIATDLVAPAGGRSTVRLVRLDSESAASAAGLCAARSRSNAVEVREVIFDGAVHAGAVAAVFAVDLRGGLCARLPRFHKDWMEIVHPPYASYLEMLFREYEGDGAKWVPAPGASGYLLELPGALQDELLANGQALVRAYKQPLAFGDRVEAQYGLDDEEWWWPATVDRVRPHGCDVIYDDDDVECNKPLSRVRRLPGVCGTLPLSVQVRRVVVRVSES